MNYTITLTNTQKQCMDYITADIDDWIGNAVNNRVRLAKEEIISLNTKHCNANDIAIAVGEDAQITQAYDLGVVKTQAQRDAEVNSLS